MDSSFALQEKYVTDKFKLLEQELRTKADKPYQEINNSIATTLKGVFEKYKNFPSTLQYLLIKQELERMNFFNQLKVTYGTAGVRYVDFLKGFLKKNFDEAYTHAHDIIDVEPNTELDFEEPTTLSQHIAKTNSYGKEITALILLLLSKHKPLEEILLEVTVRNEGFGYVAKRLGRTELAVIMNDTFIKVWDTNNVPQVKWTDATESLQFSNRNGNKKVTRVCKHCRGYATGGEGNKGIYYINKLPAPCPAHPNCRCTLVPITYKK